MSIQEFYWLHEMRRPRNPATDYAGTLTRQDCEALYHDLQAQIARKRSS